MNNQPLDLDAIEARANALNGLGIPIPGATWTASPRDEKSVCPPEMAHVVEDVLQTKDALLRSSVGVFGDEAHAEFVAHAPEDVKALLAEVRRLREQRRLLLASIARKDARTGDGDRVLREFLGADDEATRNPHAPRLCKCGHSHHAHTVPTPHSCFAHGQTCPCEAFQQLPHDEAVAQLDRNRRAAAEREAIRLAEESHVVAADTDEMAASLRRDGFGDDETTDLLARPVPAEETHVVADGSDDPEHVDDCPGCHVRSAAASKDGER